MENEIYKSKESHNFSGIFAFLKKYNCNSPKKQNDHHGHGRRNKNHISSNNKVKPGDTYKINPHTFPDEHDLKTTHGKIQQDDATDLHDLKKVNQNGNGIEDLNKMGNKQVKHHRNHSHNGCFKALFLFNAPKKKKLPAPNSSFDPQTTQVDGVKRNLDKSKSFNTVPSLGRSMSINEQGTKTSKNSKTPSNSRAPSFNRTTSTSSRTTNWKNSGTLNRATTSVGRSTSDANSKYRRMNNVTKSGPIMFSNSSGVLKPPPSEEELECTLEELYHGCIKRIKVSRRVYTFKGHVKRQDEILTVNIKPGWKTGTKITFNGTVNDENPGEMPGDIIFVITQKQHPLFRRIDDDLELEVDIPLVDALTGCNLSIPLLGKEKMSLEINDIIYPGHEKIIVGQGMPNQKNPNQMADLKVKFLIIYPKNLTDEQRSEISRILSD